MSLNEAFNWTRPLHGFTPDTFKPTPPSSSLSGVDFFVDAGPSQPKTNSPPPSPASRKAAADDALASSIAPVLLPNVIRANPSQSAATLISILAEPGYEAKSDGPFRSREMSCELRKRVVAQIDETESRALFGAILDVPAGRQLLATWLRESLDPTWSKTRMPLLRLFDELPVLPKEHLLDKETNRALPRALGLVQKKGQEKSIKLATEIRERWVHMIEKDEASSSKAVTNAGVEEGGASSKQGNKKTPAAPPRATASDTMQSLNSLSQSSAYVSALGSFASKAEGSASRSKLALSGSDRSSDMQSLAKKTVTRLAPETKDLCTKCKTPMIPGTTSSTRIKPSGPHTRKIEQTCLKCNDKVKKTPAPPMGPPTAKRRLAIELDDETGGEAKRHQPAPKTKKMAPATGARDMFSDLLSKCGPAASSSSRAGGKAGGAGAGTKAGVSSSAQPSEASNNAATTTPAPRTKPSKRVKWRDENLVEVKMIEARFDGDGDSEMHATIESSGLHGLEQDEGQALKSAAHVEDDALEEEVEWYLPREVEVPVAEGEDAVPERGAESEEKKAQEKREMSALSAIYMDVAEIPASPGEPLNAAAGEGAQPKKISLPEGWDQPPQVPAQADLNELMRQLRGGSSGGGVEAGSDAAPPSSLESYGISSSGLQNLLSSVSGSVEQQQQQYGGWQGYGGHHQQQQHHGSYYGYAPPPAHHYGGYQ